MVLILPLALPSSRAGPILCAQNVLYVPDGGIAAMLTEVGSYNGLDITYGVAYFKGGAVPIPCADCPPIE